MSCVGYRVPSASGTRTYSPWQPSFIRPSGPAVPHDCRRTQEVVTPLRQCTQVLSLIVNGEITKSPALSVVTSAPISSTTPTNSCPIGCGSDGGRAPRQSHRSEPHTQVATTRTIASVGSTITGSGRCSQRTSPLP